MSNGVLVLAISQIYLIFIYSMIRRIWNPISFVNVEISLRAQFSIPELEKGGVIEGTGPCLASPRWFSVLS